MGSSDWAVPGLPYEQVTVTDRAESIDQLVPASLRGVVGHPDPDGPVGWLVTVAVAAREDAARDGVAQQPTAPGPAPGE
jgi:hypothetical protein